MTKTTCSGGRQVRIVSTLQLGFSANSAIFECDCNCRAQYKWTFVSETDRGRVVFTLRCGQLTIATLLTLTLQCKQIPVSVTGFSALNMFKVLQLNTVFVLVLAIETYFSILLQQMMIYVTFVFKSKTKCLNFWCQKLKHRFCIQKQSHGTSHTPCCATLNFLA